MIDLFRPVFARVAAIIAASLGTWLASQGISIDPESIEALVLVLTTIFMTIYALLHRLISAKTNPHDSASPALAAEEQKE